MTLEELQQSVNKDFKLDDTELDAESIKIPLLHNKYLQHFNKFSLLLKKSEYDHKTMLRNKWEYYTGKLDDDDLKKYGWEPFPFTLKSDITTYLDADEDINKYLASKMMHEEVVDVCNAILKELNNRTWELRSFIDWEKFIQGV